MDFNEVIPNSRFISKVCAHNTLRSRLLESSYSTLDITQFNKKVFFLRDSLRLRTEQLISFRECKIYINISVWPMSMFFAWLTTPSKLSKCAKVNIIYSVFLSLTFEFYCVCLEFSVFRAASFTKIDLDQNMVCKRLFK